MRKHILVIAAVFLLFGSCNVPKSNGVTTLDRTEVDSLVCFHIERAEYAQATLLITQFVSQKQNEDSLEVALEYAIKNRELVEEHIASFAMWGITPEQYFNICEKVYFLEIKLGLDVDAIKDYLELSRAIKMISPEDLPHYAHSIAGIMGMCSTMPWADSIYCLQDALDCLKQQCVSKENVETYLSICQSFSCNRMVNSFASDIMVCNRVEELENWYKNNGSYILGLDRHLYKNEVIEFSSIYVDVLSILAGGFGNTTLDRLGQIEILNKGIAFLSSIDVSDSSIDLKIASLYAMIADCYYSLWDLPLCKQYCDKAYEYIISKKSESRDCYVILRSLARLCFSLNQNELAAELILSAIKIGELERMDNSVALDWIDYFMFIVDTKPEEVLCRNDSLSLVKKEMGESPHYWMMLGRAYSMLMDTDDTYRYAAEKCLYKADSVLSANSDFWERIGQKNKTKGLLYEEWATHYSRLDQKEKSFEFSKKAIGLDSSNYACFYKVALKACLLHDISAIHEYLPRFYYGREREICNMLPVLGSVESDSYLGNGESNLYHIPVWASWNPQDDVSVRTAYDAALLMKGLTLRYNVLSPYFEIHPEIEEVKHELDRMRDSIYSIFDEDERLLELHRYQMKERELLKEVNNELTNVHWGDVARRMKENEACVEFVKYTANAYSWCDGDPTPHYAAMVLLPNASAPIFVDLFDEAEVLDVYELQPKSYDTEIGQALYSKIWGRLHRYIKGKNKVFFSPMGLLNLINIELLTDADGRTAAENYNLYRVSSTKNVLLRNESGNLRSLASFGGIDYESDKDYADAMRGLNTRGNWAYLQNTLLEVEQIEDLLKDNGVDVATYTGSRATEVAFKQLDGTQADIIHIATHGYYIPQAQRNAIPYFANSANTVSVQDELFYSGLILAGGQIAWADSVFKPNNNDGILTAYEISKLDLHNVNLVVLSACETGLGDNLFDGIFGLQRAFKKAGASSILMSLWKIDDRATLEYMNLFYEKLVEGYSKHDAYISTVFTMKEKYPDANYWASFVLLD